MAQTIIVIPTGTVAVSEADADGNRTLQVTDTTDGTQVIVGPLPVAVCVPVGRALLGIATPPLTVVEPRPRRPVRDNPQA